MEDASTTTLLDKEQAAFIESVKQEIRTAQHRALRQVNQEMILLYWKIGKMLNEHVAYGNQFIDQLARELRFSFPDMKGLSARNLRYMKRFAEENEDKRILQTVFAKLPWSHNIRMLDKVSNEKSVFGMRKKQSKTVGRCAFSNIRSNGSFTSDKPKRRKSRISTNVCRRSRANSQRR